MKMNKEIENEISRLPSTNNITKLYHSTKFFKLLSYPTFYRYYTRTHKKSSKPQLPTIKYLDNIYMVDFINVKKYPAPLRIKRTFNHNIKLVQFTYFKHNKPVKTYYFIHYYSSRSESFKLVLGIARKLGIKKLVVDRQLPVNLVNNSGVELFIYKGVHKAPVEYFGFFQRTIHKDRDIKKHIRELNRLTSTAFYNLVNYIDVVIKSHFSNIPTICLNKLFWLSN